MKNTFKKNIQDPNCGVAYLYVADTMKIVVQRM